MLKSILACAVAVCSAANLSGTVTDKAGNGLAGVDVSLGSAGIATTTNAKGEWSLVKLGRSQKPSRTEPVRWNGHDLEFFLAKPSIVKLEAFDPRGALVGPRRILHLEAGSRRVEWSLRTVPLAWIRVTINGQRQFLNVRLGRGEMRVGQGTDGSLGSARAAAMSDDTLRFKWKSRIVVSLPMPSRDSSGIQTRIDTSRIVDAIPSLLWPDGIEPGDPSFCEAPQGKRCWWVDAAAGSNGDGNYSSPYNDFKQLEQNVHGGDFVYVRGTFDMATNSPSHQMTLNFYTLAASGTRQEPTTLKSWRGSPRAVFSSARTDAQVRMTRTGGIRLQNIEITNFGDVGISVDEGVEYAELVSIVARDGRVTQSSGIGGGVRLYAQDRLHTFVVRNCLFENTSDSSQIGGNVGALSLISEPSALPGSTFTVFNSVFRGNFVAIRHKHAGQVHMEAFHNRIEGNSIGLHLRTWSSDIHDNILIGNEIAILLENAVANADHKYLVRHNTLYDNDYFALASPDWDDNNFHASLDIHDNVFYASKTGRGVFHLGVYDWNWGRLDRSLATWKMGNNVYFYQPSTRHFLYSPPPTPEYTKDFSEGKSQFGDSTSILADPLFQRADSGDFSFKPGSPAIGAGSGGITPGARGVKVK